MRTGGRQVAEVEGDTPAVMPPYVVTAETFELRDCGHWTVAPRKCFYCSGGDTEYTGIVDWPAGAVPLTTGWIGWARSFPLSSITRRSDGSLAFRRSDCRPATVIEAAGGGYMITETDGSWPARFTGFVLAGAVARARQTLLHFPRAGRLFRGEPCWRSPWLKENSGRKSPGKAKRGRINVAAAVARELGRQVTDARAGKGVGMPSHRVSFYVFGGVAPQLGTVDHACDFPSCANPRHLDDMTEKDNMARGAEKLWRIQQKMPRT